MKECGSVETKSLLQNIVDEYLSYCYAYFEENEFFQSDVTMACIDLSYAQKLEETLNDFFGVLKEDISGYYNELAVSRVKTRAFGRATTGSEYDLIDIQDLMVMMQDSYKKETQQVQDVLDKMIVYNEANVVQSCGLSIYYPYYNKKYYEQSWKDDYSELGVLPNYIQYLERYSQIWLGTDMKEYFNGKLVAEGGDSNEYKLPLNPEQIERYAEQEFICRDIFNKKLDIYL